jgi:hypothetical protein
MSATDPYIEEIRSIVNRYKAIEELMNSLLEEANLLNLKKQDIELKLAQNKEDERNLIDKIKRETGKEPNLYEILQSINSQTQTHENSTVV